MSVFTDPTCTVQLGYVPIPLDVCTTSGAFEVWFVDLRPKANNGPAFASNGPMARADATDFNSPTMV
jgi:hypothetical protein